MKSVRVHKIVTTDKAVYLHCDRDNVIRIIRVSDFHSSANFMDGYFAMEERKNSTEMQVHSVDVSEIPTDSYQAGYCDNIAF